MGTGTCNAACPGGQHLRCHSLHLPKSVTGIKRRLKRSCQTNSSGPCGNLQAPCRWPWLATAVTSPFYLRARWIQRTYLIMVIIFACQSIENLGVGVKHNYPRQHNYRPASTHRYLPCFRGASPLRNFKQVVILFAELDHIIPTKQRRLLGKTLLGV